MIIKSHIRGGYRSAADYMKDIGQNETTRLVQISDPDAENLDEAFQNMWAVASTTRSVKPLHHISINPMKDERLTDEQVMKIVERAEKKYGYKTNDHQRVIVEHVKDGRQHFHVIWNRVNLTTGKPVWPGEHWNKSKQICREMERELGLKRPTPRRLKAASPRVKGRSLFASSKRYDALKAFNPFWNRPLSQASRTRFANSKLLPRPLKALRPSARRSMRIENIPASENLPVRRPDHLSRNQIIAWAWENKRYDVLALYGIYVDMGPG